MDYNYKAVPYKTTKTIQDEYEEYSTTEIRYRIVSVDTGEVLDDAQGYGYKTAQKAYAGYSYKNRDKSKDKAKQEKVNKIKKWMKENKSFIKYLEVIAFEIMKDSCCNETINATIVNELLKENKLSPDFTANELLKVWRKY